MDIARKLRKSVYEIDESLKEKFPAKATTDVLEDEIKYCQELIEVIDSCQVRGIGLSGPKHGRSSEEEIKESKKRAYQDSRGRNEVEG